MMAIIAPVLEAVAIAALFMQKFPERNIVDVLEDYTFIIGDGWKPLGFGPPHLCTQERRDDTIVDVGAWMRAEITK